MKILLVLYADCREYATLELEFFPSHSIRFRFLVEMLENRDFNMFQQVYVLLNNHLNDKMDLYMKINSNFYQKYKHLPEFGDFLKGIDNDGSILKLAIEKNNCPLIDLIVRVKIELFVPRFLRIDKA